MTYSQRKAILRLRPRITLSSLSQDQLKSSCRIFLRSSSSAKQVQYTNSFCAFSFSYLNLTKERPRTRSARASEIEAEESMLGSLVSFEVWEQAGLGGGREVSLECEMFFPLLLFGFFSLLVQLELTPFQLSSFFERWIRLLGTGASMLLDEESSETVNLCLLLGQSTTGEASSDFAPFWSANYRSRTVTVQTFIQGFFFEVFLVLGIGLGWLVRRVPLPISCLIVSTCGLGDGEPLVGLVTEGQFVIRRDWFRVWTGGFEGESLAIWVERRRMGQAGQVGLSGRVNFSYFCCFFTQFFFSCVGIDLVYVNYKSIETIFAIKNNPIPLLVLKQKNQCSLGFHASSKIRQINYRLVGRQQYPSMSDSLHSVSLSYEPYKYPPDFNLALLHQRCSMPGTPDRSLPPCPCCKEHPKIPFSNWWGRSIQHDFKHFGGAIVSYFWLLKLYILGIAVITCIYGFYLQYLTQHYCNQLEDHALRLQVCGNLFGLWVISNADLHDLMVSAGDRDVVVRFSTLRSMVFLVLLAIGIAALYMMRWFKVRYPDKIQVSSFALLFKNLPTPNLEDLVNRLRSEFGDFQIKESFIIKKIEPFYTAYQKKLEKYYQMKIESNPKKKLKLQKDLEKLDKFCTEHEDEYHHCGRRAIIVFYSREVRDEIYEKYKISRVENFKLFFSGKYSEEREVYCEECPKPSEMLWNNLGKEEKEGFKVKVKSIIYFFLVLGVFYLFLFFALQTIYIDDLVEPLKTIVQFLILFFITVLALTFRRIMDMLSQLRFPNTYTQRSMFIVMTTVAFHYLFYLFIPAIYLAVQVDRRGDVLKCISSQTISFVLFQILLCSVDIMYCLWGRSRKRVQDQQHPIGCQKILHSKIQYPRFPIQFKLIVLFKFWSLTTFFSFHTPMVLILIMVALVFHYIKDKKNLYQHFRMEVINNKVQINFLQFYTNVFVVFMFVIFIATQHSTIEYVLASIVVSGVIVFQNVYFRRGTKRSQDEEEGQGPKTLDDLPQELNISYQERYNHFLEISKNDKIDKGIKEELYGSAFSSIEESQISAKLLR